jgi:hypothetical protein
MTPVPNEIKDVDLVREEEEEPADGAGDVRTRNKAEETDLLLLLLPCFLGDENIPKGAMTYEKKLL